MAKLLQDLRDTLQNTPQSSLATAIVNQPFVHKADMVLMGIGIIVLLIKSSRDGQIHRVALSNTELGEATKKISIKKFEDIKIPADHQVNVIARVIATNSPQMTSDWRYLFTPALSPEQARLNQAAGGIACSHVYPVHCASDKGALIFSFYKEPDAIDTAAIEFMRGYSEMVSDILTQSVIHLDKFLD